LFETCDIQTVRTLVTALLRYVNSAKRYDPLLQTKRSRTSWKVHIVESVDPKIVFLDLNYFEVSLKIVLI